MVLSIGNMAATADSQKALTSLAVATADIIVRFAHSDSAAVATKQARAGRRLRRLLITCWRSRHARFALSVLQGWEPACSWEGSNVTAIATSPLGACLRACRARDSTGGRVSTWRAGERSEPVSSEPERGREADARGMRSAASERSERASTAIGWGGSRCGCRPGGLKGRGALVCL